MSLRILTRLWEKFKYGLNGKMEHDGVNAACDAALKKINFSKYRARYFVYAAMAGCFCSMGMALAFSVSAGFYSSEALRGAHTFMLGAMFTLSFTLITFAGAELFTGNVLVMTMAFLQRKIKFSECAGLLAYCYLANICGAAFMGLIISLTGVLAGQTGDMLVFMAREKAALSLMHGFFRGVMCNMMVCLGTWCVLKLKSESAKLIILFWCVLGFVALGYEHSIANAGIFTMAALCNTGSPIGYQGIILNMLPVTLGNLAGGSVFVALVYWFSGGGQKATGSQKE